MSESSSRSNYSVAETSLKSRVGAKTIKRNTNSTQNKSQTHRAKQYEVTSFLSTDCELSTETCSKNVYSLGPWCRNEQVCQGANGRAVIAIQRTGCCAIKTSHIYLLQIIVLNCMNGHSIFRARDTKIERT